MPVVPRYNQPSVDPSGIPSVKGPGSTSIESFGGGPALERAGAAAHSLASTGLDIWEAEKKKADEIAVRDADISTAELSNRLEHDVRQLRGKDAASAPDYINDNWNKGVDNIMSSLKTDNQRQAADRIFRSRRLALDDSAQVHMAGEFKKYDDQQFQTAIDLYRNEGSMKYNRPDAVANSIFKQESEIDKYGDRNGLPTEWKSDAKAKARSATYRDVLERMLVDGNDALAKKYEKGINKYILPDDVSILEKVRKEDKVRKEEQQNEYERGMFLALADSKVSDAGKITALEHRFRAGDMTVAQFERAKGWVLQTFDKPEIPIEEKVGKYDKLISDFIELDGVKTDENGKPITPASGNDFKTVSKFRNKVADAKGYLTRNQYEKMIEYTQSDFDASRAPKKSLFKSLSEIMPLLPNINPLAQRDIMERAIGIFDRNVSPQQASQTIQKLKDEAVVIGNPNRTKYAIGDVIVNAKGERAEVVRYDQQTGNPVLKKL